VKQTFRSKSVRAKATICVAFLFISLFLPGVVFGQPNALQEHFFKGLWVIRHNLTDKSSIDQVIDFAKSNGFRQIIMQVRGRGFAFYQSDIVPRAPLIKEPGFDPLAYTIERAHAAGLEVHAWLNVYVLWTARTKPTDPTHLIYQHPEWTDADNRGVMNMDMEWEGFRNGMQGGIYLSPTHPEVNPYLRDVMEEVIDKYAIDGLHLDYIRYQNVIAGYNPTGREVFRNQFGVDPLLLAQISRLDTSNWDERSYQIYVDTWNAYRRDQVTSLVRQIKELCSINDVALSAAVKPNLNNARSRFFQDWAYWIDEGLLDFAIPMNYAEDLDLFMTNLKIIEETLPREKVVMGIGVYNQSKFDVSEKILKTLSAQFQGFCLFSYDTFTENPSYIDVIRRFVLIE